MTVALNGIIYFSWFSVWFCDNSRLMLKCVFRSCLSQAKSSKGLPVRGKYWFCCIYCPFIYKTVSQILEILVLRQDFTGKVHHFCEINFISSWNLMKSFYLPNKTNKKKFETRFCKRKTAEDKNVKINISLNITCTFLLYISPNFLTEKNKS